ncbi:MULTISPECIES: EamA/RhaT family transporter [Myroides]|uniref:EamA/RhaT family transporter n=1 Tax=Myroides albus TaxID=2562892 RepID=A0A6I3LMP1_9FLAO|nr:MULTISPECIES: EamA/RhaT family transporter [Myroides]MTG97442.1 EamA/RhaT family transporter [Myroides albus]MVX37215.1 EamA/RhaT family transporter [Myroides sp. LoEW2-1]
MLYLILSILGSVSVGILFKFSKKTNANIMQMVLLNYIITVLLSYFNFNVELNQLSLNLPILTIILLGLLLPTIFVVQYLSIFYSGIIRTDIAQRMSLFIPILAAIFIFKEQISTQRYIALFIGLASVYLILQRPNSVSETLSENKKNIIFPLLTFIGFGVIDILFKQLALYSEVPYTSSLFYVFFSALILTLLYYFIITIYKRNSLFTVNKNTLVYGILLGVLNFINILFYMKAHQVFAQSPTTVFAGMNFGVIILGTLIGYFGFKEKLSKQNLIGLALVIVSILVILI